jgi:hypothetical protein
LLVANIIGGFAMPLELPTNERDVIGNHINMWPTMKEEEESEGNSYYYTK